MLIYSFMLRLIKHLVSLILNKMDMFNQMEIFNKMEIFNQMDIISQINIKKLKNCKIFSKLELQ